MKQQPGKLSIPTLAGCLIAQLCVGIIYLWSVFKSSAITYYGWEDGAVNLVASFMLFLFCAGNLIGGILQDRTTPRLSAMIGIFLFGGGILLSSLIPANGSILWFYITYCAMGGMGSGFVYASALNCLQRWLPHRRGLATGLAASTFGLSTVVFSPVCNGLLGRMSMPMALRTLAGVLFVIGLLACLFIRRPGPEYLKGLDLPQKDAKTIIGLSPARAMSTPQYWLLFAALFFYNGTWNMLTPLIAGLGTARGLSQAAAVTCVSLTGLTNACGRLGMSALSDKLGRIPTILILCIITTGCGIALTGCTGIMYTIIVLLTAFAFGGPSAVFPAFTTDMFGAKYSGSNYGVIMLGLGLSSVVFNAISNRLYAATGTYTLTFLMGAATGILSLILILGVNHFLKQSKS